MLEYYKKYKKSLMFKYGRMQKKIPCWLVCGSCGTYLVNMLPRVQITVGLGFFLFSVHLSDQ